MKGYNMKDMAIRVVLFGIVMPIVVVGTNIALLFLEVKSRLTGHGPYQVWK